MNDPDPLDHLLKSWQPKPSAREDFADQVHGRIAAEAVKTKGAKWRFSTALPLAASLAIIAGTVAGTSTGGQPDKKAMADAYALSIDPVRMMDLESHP